MGPFGMDRRLDFPDYFAGFKCESVDENVYNSIDDKMSDMNHLLLEPIVADSYLGPGMENMGINTKMDDFSHGFDFNYLPDYGGLYTCTFQDREAGLKPEILNGFLDEVEDIYVSSPVCDHSVPETQVKKNVVELASDSYGLMNLSSDSYSPGISGNIGLSECSKETVHESEDDKKPLSTFIGSWTKRGRTRKKNSSNGTKSLVSYDFRPRKGTLKKKHIQITSSVESEDDDISVTKKSKSRSDRRMNQRMWTIEEVVKLVNGISHFGVGKWTDIKKYFFHSDSHRTPVDIRDKWRNLLKASYNHGEAEEKQRSAVHTIPKDILDRVRELAYLHPYPFSKSPCLAQGSLRSRSISRKKKKRCS